MKRRWALGVIGGWTLQSACGSGGGGSLGSQVNTDVVSIDTNAEGADANVEMGETKIGEMSSVSRTNSDASDDVSGDASSTASAATSNTVSSDGPSSIASFGGETTAEETSEKSFEVSVHLAREEYVNAPTTVAIVDWATSLGIPSSAKIEFGLTTDYGVEAPVDSNDDRFRGVLLGMKPERTYHFRIVAEIEGKQVVSDDYTVTTGEGPTSKEVGQIAFEVGAGEPREAGFILTSYWSGEQEGMVFILDQDGDVVWWYPSRLSHGVAKAAISADGRDLWMASGSGFGSELLRRVGMDGLNWEDYPQADASHDIVAVEGDVMAFIDYGYNGIVEIDRLGWEKFIVRTSDLPETDVGHHLNALSYSDGNYVVSSHDVDVFILPRREEVKVADIISLTSLVGPVSNWGGYHHGVELLPGNHLLLFANREGGEARRSTVIEFDLDEGHEVWRHESTLYTQQFGDAQRLPGGNTLVTYSNAGVIHEVSHSGDIVLSVTASPFLGYATWLPSLYGTR